MAETSETKAGPEVYDGVLAKLPPIFRKCCDPEVTKYDMAGPAEVGGNLWACDARILVCVPVRDIGLAAEIQAIRLKRNGGRARFPKHVVDLFAGPWQKDALVVPEGLPRPEPCQRCKGKKVVEDVVLCDACLGDGCGGCDGRGVTFKRGSSVPCLDCEGLGYDPCAGADLGPVHLAWKYLDIILEAGGVLYPSVDNPLKSGVMFLAPGGISGVVMPLSR